MGMFARKDKNFDQNNDMEMNTIEQRLEIFRRVQDTADLGEGGAGAGVLAAVEAAIIAVVPEGVVATGVEEAVEVRSDAEVGGVGGDAGHLGAVACGRDGDGVGDQERGHGQRRRGRGQVT